jgi:hypothetical protein
MPIKPIGKAKMATNTETMNNRASIRPTFICVGYLIDPRKVSRRVARGRFARDEPSRKGRLKVIAAHGARHVKHLAAQVKPAAHP